jgi:RNA polymerase sigma-70 factor, ECF subfamily
VASLTPTAPFITVGVSLFGRAGGDDERAPLPPTTARPAANRALASDAAGAAVFEDEEEAGEAAAAADPIRAAANAAMSRYARGEDEAFAPLYDAMAPRLHRYLVRQTRDQARADDLLQQTMLHVHRARGRFAPGAEVFPWAFAIARRLLIDSIRRGKHEVLARRDRERDGGGDGGRQEIAGNARGADELLDSKRLAHAVERELARMPEQHRVAFELIKQEGLSVKEAAAVLGTTSTAVKLRAHRAYNALRAALGNVFHGN